MTSEDSKKRPPQRSPDEPQKKKPKLDTSNVDQSNDQKHEVKTRPFNAKVHQERAKLTPKRKVAMVVGYKGTNFRGNQIQKEEETKTVEGELWEALKQTNAILEQNKVDPKKIGWSRTSRTDRGVHALVNMVECKLHVYDGLVDELNNILQDEKTKENSVMVHGYSRVTKGFKARMSCDGREYWYLLPTFVFNRNDKIRHYKRTDDFSNTESVLDTRMFEISQQELDQHVDCSYRMSKEDCDYVNQLMSRFEGTHFFHNFTRMSKDVKLSQTQRYITKFSIDDPFYDQETQLEWTIVKIHGASFLLNQIRKMIGTVIAICKGSLDESIFDTVFDKGNITYTPRIPGHGLMLKDMKFGAYNEYKSGVHGKLQPYDDFRSQVDIFKKQLLRHIMKMETENQEWQRWVFLLNKLVNVEKDPIDFEKASERIKDTTINKQVSIQAPMDQVWSVAGNFKQLPSYYLDVIETAIEGDKSHDEAGAVRVVKHNRADQPGRWRIKRHCLDLVDHQKHTLKYTCMKLKKFTDTSTVKTVIQATKISDSETNLSWTIHIDVGTKNFVTNQGVEMEEALNNIKRDIESKE